MHSPAMVPRAVGSAALFLLAACAVAWAADRMASESRGSGAPTIVLVHGIGGDRTDWDRVAPALAARHRVVLVDLPGHGASPVPKRIDVATAARLLREALKERRVEGALLVGHSYGALVTLEAAAADPSLAAAVVAVDAATFTPADSAQIAAIDNLMFERYMVFLQAIFGRMTTDEARGESLMVRAARVNQGVLSSYFRNAWREDLRPRIASMKTPIHLVATATLWPPQESWTNARRRLGYESRGPAVGHRIENSGHYIAFDQPDSLASAIARIARGIVP